MKNRKIIAIGLGLIGMLFPINAAEAPARPGINPKIARLSELVRKEGKSDNTAIGRMPSVQYTLMRNLNIDGKKMKVRVDYDDRGNKGVDENDVIRIMISDDKIFASARDYGLNGIARKSGNKYILDTLVDYANGFLDEKGNVTYAGEGCGFGKENGKANQLYLDNVRKILNALEKGK